MIRRALNSFAASHRGGAGGDGVDELDEAIGHVRMFHLLQERFARLETHLSPLCGEKLFLSRPYGFTRTVADLRAARRLLQDMEGDAQASAPPSLWTRALTWPTTARNRLRSACHFLRLAIRHRSFKDAKWQQEFEGAPWL